MFKFKRRKRSIYESLVTTVPAYRCRNGQLFEQRPAAEDMERLLIQNERIADNINFAKANVRCESIPASGGLFNFRIESEHLEALEIWALDWKNRYFGYSPHISTAEQSDADGPWHMVLTRWSKC